MQPKYRIPNVCNTCISVVTARWVVHLEHLSAHRVSKNVPPSACYNLDIHDPIMTIIFGRNVTEKVRNHMMLCFSTSSV